MKLDNTKKCFMCLWLEDWGSFMCSFPLPNSTAASALDAPFPITSSAVAFSGLCLPLPSVFLSAQDRCCFSYRVSSLLGAFSICAPACLSEWGVAGELHKVLAPSMSGHLPLSPSLLPLCVPGFGPVLQVVTSRLALLFSPSVPGTQRL